MAKKQFSTEEKITNGLALIHDVDAVRHKLRGLARTNRDFLSIDSMTEDMLSNLIGCIVSDIRPQTIGDVLALPECMQLDGLLFLLSVIDTSEECDDDDELFFCADWYFSEITDRTDTTADILATARADSDFAEGDGHAVAGWLEERSAHGYICDDCQAKAAAKPQIVQ